MEPKIIITILEMLRDRKYTFHSAFQPDKLIQNIPIPPENCTDSERAVYQKELDKYHQGLTNIPWISNKITDTSIMPINDQGIPIYVFIQNDDETANPFNDNQADRLAITKQIVLNLKHAFPNIASAKKINEIYEEIHLILVFNGVKREMIKLEEEAFKTYKFEAWPKYRLRYNVTKHQIQGRYRKLNKEETEEYKQQFETTVATIQVYRIDDPIVRYYHGQPGDIFHIIRFKGGENYRMVGKKTIFSVEKK